jgi:predicted signal transduction protein with EAL and GGDEF domain
VIAGHDADRLAVEYAERLITRIVKPFDIGRHRVIVGASAGVALCDPNDNSPDDALKRADMALYRAKADGRNAFAVFEPCMLTVIEARQRLELDLWRAVDRNQFEVWYQPQIGLRDGDLIGAEALLRWRHPERGLISPEEFIPVAEAIGLIEALGRWALETACADAAGWPVPIKLAVNVSSVQFVRSDMVQTVSRALERSTLAPSRLDLEITESLFMQPTESVYSALTRLRAIGVGVALDDFGTGYSSLSYIHKFPIDKIKIDGSFVSGLPMDLDSSAIVRAIAALAKNLDIRLNAEAIETVEQAAFLRRLGVDEGQGYLYGRPQLAADITALMVPPVLPKQMRA